MTSLPRNFTNPDSAPLTGFVDYHIHTRLCGHADGEIEEYLDGARAAGLAEIGFSDHFPLLDHDRTGLTMSLEEFPLYYEAVNRLRETCPDVIKKYGHAPSFDPLSCFEKAAEAIAGAGMCVEINTSGLRKPAREIFPSPEFLRFFREGGVPITLGSDAHKPAHVAGGFAEAAALARACGYEEYVLFSGRGVRATATLPG
ncbi:MAG: PHP domain-containing protein [Candidatus Eisenbacteria bacterium]